MQVDNLEIAYLEGGSEKNPTLLLIHGFGADKDNWLRFARPLTERYHVVALDLPGFGDSSKPQQASLRRRHPGRASRQFRRRHRRAPPAPGRQLHGRATSPRSTRRAIRNRCYRWR
ncbi:alpha/beta fold hydrolase [Pseudomonas aeruginosa]|nr:alpha/beta fold hydrolase [Pseudomonas aeruginosa]